MVRSAAVALPPPIPAFGWPDISWGPVVGTRLLEVYAAEVEQGVKGECKRREPVAQN